MSITLDPAPQIPGWNHIYSGKVRNLYEPEGVESGTSDTLLVVATDRISAFDHMLSPLIPDKGAILTQMSLWWFNTVCAPAAEQAGIAHHVVSTEVPYAVRGRAMVVKRLDMFPIECIARGYLTGSGLAEYQNAGTVTGIKLPAGLVDGSRLDTPIFTPSAKAAVGDHDENITYDEMVNRIGADDAAVLKDLTMQLYTRAEEVARQAGIILADTKVEFGRDPNTGDIILGDEVLTPDSSRFWDAELYAPGSSQASFDKQFVRDWLASDASGWDRTGEPPELPADIVEKTRDRYLEAYRRLTGEEFVPFGN